MKKKKILILANNSTGLYKLRKELLTKLLGEYSNVYIALPRGSYIEKLQELGCNYIETGFDRRGQNPLGEVRLICKYIEIARKIKPDLVLTYTIKPNIYGGIVCSFFNIPYMPNITGIGTSMQEGSKIRSLLTFLYKLAFRKASCVFFQNTDNMTLFKKTILSNQKTCLIPGSGVNISENAYVEYPDEDKIRFLSVFRIMKDKGIEELLRASKYLNDKYENLVFDLVGTFDDLEYEEEIKALQKAGVINHLGFRKDVCKIMAKSHCVIHPSYHEGLSNVLLEAAACGRPVIASKIPGCQETFVEGVSGIGVEAKSAKSLIEGVGKFLALSYEERAEMGKRGRKHVEKNFDRKIVINKYMEEINRLIG